MLFVITHVYTYIHTHMHAHAHTHTHKFVIFNYFSGPLYSDDDDVPLDLNS